MAFSALACRALLLTGLLYSGNGRAMPSDYRTTMIEESPKTGGTAKPRGRGGSGWQLGLSFQQEGSAPIGNATPEYLAKFQAYYIGAGDPKAKKNLFDL